MKERRCGIKPTGLRAEYRRDEGEIVESDSKSPSYTRDPQSRDKGGQGGRCIKKASLVAERERKSGYNLGLLKLASKRNRLAYEE